MNIVIFSIVRTIYSVIIFLFKALWKMLKPLRTLLLILILVFSISLNAAMFMGGTIYSAASSVFDTVTGLRSVATQHATEIADISDDLVNERRLKREAVDATSDRISRRAAKSAKREVGSVFGEAIPYAGVAIIVGVTALELNDLCNTLKDMQKLKEIFDPDAAPDENVPTVCAMEVPTKEEVWASVKEAPAAAWEGVRASIPELPDLPEVDWSGVWTSIEGGAVNSWDTIKDVSTQIADGVERAADDIQSGTNNLASQLGDWWSGTP